MARLPDLVRDSQLEAVFRNGLTVHTFFESSPSSRQRAVPREEVWRLEKQVGSGGFGSIWLEKCMEGPQKGGLRAVKKIAVRQQGLEDITYVRELEAVAKFSQRKYVHCFVQSFGWYESPGSLCIALEYCELGDLQGYLSSNPPVPEPQAQDIIFQMLEGTRYMHEHEFAHRDLKPANILIKARPPEPWWVKISDFGISKRIEEGAGAASTMRGTPRFIAPELFLHNHDATDSTPVSRNPYAADMWALGEITHQILTKQSSFMDTYQLFLYVQNSKTSPFPVSVLIQSGVSASGQIFVSSLMSVSPEKRFTVIQALSHEWIKQLKLSYMTPGSVLPNSTVAESEPPAMSTADSLDEQFATWTTFPKMTPMAETAIPSLFGGDQNQIRRPSSPSEPTYIPDASSSTDKQDTPSGHIKSQKTLSPSYETMTLKPLTNLSAKREVPLEPLTITSAEQEVPLKPSINTSAKREVPRGYSLRQRFKFTQVMSVAFSADGNSFASANENLIEIWDSATGLLQTQFKRGSSPVHTIVFSSDGQQLVLGNQDTIRVLHLPTHSLVHARRGISMTSVALSPNGKWIVSADGDGTVWLWDLVQNKSLVLQRHSKPVHSVVFSPDGKRIASASKDNTVRVWDTTTCEQVWVLQHRHCRSLAFSPDSRLLAMTNDRAVLLWDEVKGELVTAHERHSSVVYSVAFSSDGQRLVTGTRDGTVTVWMTKGDVIQVLRKHSKIVHSVVFSPDDMLLLSVDNQSIRLWDASLPLGL